MVAAAVAAWLVPAVVEVVAAWLDHPAVVEVVVAAWLDHPAVVVVAAWLVPAVAVVVGFPEADSKECRRDQRPGPACQASLPGLVCRTI